MTITYDLKSSQDLTESTISEIVRDLQFLAEESAREGQFVNEKYLRQMEATGKFVLSRMQSEKEFLEGGKNDSPCI